MSPLGPPHLLFLGLCPRPRQRAELFGIRNIFCFYLLFSQTCAKWGPSPIPNQNIMFSYVYRFEMHLLKRRSRDGMNSSCFVTPDCSLCSKCEIVHKCACNLRVKLIRSCDVEQLILPVGSKDPGTASLRIMFRHIKIT